MKNYRIKIETWNIRGLNLGVVIHEMGFDNTEKAIEEAREMYKTILPREKSKELKIFTEDGLIWNFRNGKVTIYKPEPLKKVDVPVGNIVVEPKKEHS